MASSEWDFNEYDQIALVENAELRRDLLEAVQLIDDLESQVRYWKRCSRSWRVTADERAEMIRLKEYERLK